MHLGVRPGAILKPNEQDSDIYLDSHMQGVGLEAFPHLNRYPQAAGAGVGQVREAWVWIQ